VAKIADCISTDGPGKIEIANLQPQYHGQQGYQGGPNMFQQPRLA
jgi:hypothetical protein